MARAAGKTSKKSAAKKRSKRREQKRVAVSLVETATAHDAVDARAAQYPTIYAFADSDGSDPFAAGSPAFDQPQMLPELVCLQLMAVRHFRLYPLAAPCPSKKTLMDFLRTVPLSDGSRVSKHHASVLATAVRPRDAMRGGAPRGKRPAEGEPDPENR